MVGEQGCLFCSMSGFAGRSGMRRHADVTLALEDRWEMINEFIRSGQIAVFCETLFADERSH